MRNKKSFSTLILSLLAVMTLAQTPALNFEKYMIYRNRLLDDFMVSSSGNELGTNIPASIRNEYSRQMRWGDATINLSNYMAMLATEYRLFKNNGFPVEQTLIELHNSLLAMERLDAGAGVFFENRNALPWPNGFFIRDDIPENFTREWAWKNPSFENFPNVKSDFIDKNTRLNEMSQDQVWHLIVGLALISHLVDDTTTIHIPEYHGALRLTIAQRAMMAGHRIIKAMQDKTCLFSHNDGSGIFCIHFWHLKNPYLGVAVKRGPNPNFLKHGFAESGNFITQKAFGDMHWGTSKRGGIWFNLSKSFQISQRLLPSGNFEYIYYLGSTATVGNVWSTRDLIRLFNNHQQLPFSPKPQYEHFALISCVLHDDCPQVLQRERPRYQHLLDVAPMAGPFNYGYNPDRLYEHEWSSINRFVWPERRGTGTREHHQGEYNGLDYMMLFNLYQLVYNPKGLQQLRESE
jgi:hypothetical protein